MSKNVDFEKIISDLEELLNIPLPTKPTRKKYLIEIIKILKDYNKDRQ